MEAHGHFLSFNKCLTTLSSSDLGKRGLFISDEQIRHPTPDAAVAVDTEAEKQRVPGGMGWSDGANSGGASHDSNSVSGSTVGGSVFGGTVDAAMVEEDLLSLEPFKRRF